MVVVALFCSRACDAAIASGVPISTGLHPVHLQHDALRADLAAEHLEPPPHGRLVLVLDRRRELRVGLQFLRGGHRIRAPVLEQVLGDRLRLPELGVEARVVTRVEQEEERDPHRDHRHDDDHREEEPQPAAEGGLEQGH